ncbi:hypothetical protein [Streptomyces sp. SID6139]|uniref:hypothetical protein n=1 Tax=Streptomyces sp. SID6139 TaxID=2690320 RepID=UPI00136B677D|nr:hypothetical protein [Streptomyces sp. SID6139]
MPNEFPIEESRPGRESFFCGPDVKGEGEGGWEYSHLRPCLVTHNGSLQAQLRVLDCQYAETFLKVWHWPGQEYYFNIEFSYEINYLDALSQKAPPTSSGITVGKGVISTTAQGEGKEVKNGKSHTISNPGWYLLSGIYKAKLERGAAWEDYGLTISYNEKFHIDCIGKVA